MARIIYGLPAAVQSREKRPAIPGSYKQGPPASEYQTSADQGSVFSWRFIETDQPGSRDRPLGQDHGDQFAFCNLHFAFFDLHFCICILQFALCICNQFCICILAFAVSDLHLHPRLFCVTMFVSQSKPNGQSWRWKKTMSFARRRCIATLALFFFNAPVRWFNEFVRYNALNISLWHLSIYVLCILFIIYVGERLAQCVLHRAFRAQRFFHRVLCTVPLP